MSLFALPFRSYIDTAHSLRLSYIKLVPNRHLLGRFYPSRRQFEFSCHLVHWGVARPTCAASRSSHQGNAEQDIDVGPGSSLALSRVCSLARCVREPKRGKVDRIVSAGILTSGRVDALLRPFIQGLGRLTSQNSVRQRAVVAAFGWKLYRYFRLVGIDHTEPYPPSFHALEQHEPCSVRAGFISLKALTFCSP